MQGQPLPLRTYNGHYVNADSDFSGSIDAYSTQAGTWETFHAIMLPDGKWALRTVDGKYFSGSSNGTLTATVPWISTDERWAIHHVANDDTFAFQSAHGKYMVAAGAGGGAVNANRTAIGPWEQFQVYD